MPFLFPDLRLMGIAFLNCGNRNGELLAESAGLGKETPTWSKPALSVSLSSTPIFRPPPLFPFLSSSTFRFPSNHSEVASDPASPVPMARFAFLSLALFSVQALIGGTLAAVRRRSTV